MTTASSRRADALRKAGEEALAKGRLDDASSFFAQSLAIVSDDMQSLCGLSASRYGLGDFDSALQIAKRASAVAPRAVQPLAYVGAPALILNDEEAVSFCFEVLRKVEKKLSRELVNFWTARLVERERFDEAARAFEVFSSAYPDDPDVMNAYAELLLGASRPEEAMERVEAALAAGAGGAEPLVLRARANLQRGNIAAARADALAAIDADNANLSAYFVLADIAPAAITEAMTDRLEKALEEGKAGGDVLALVGSALGRARESRQQFDAAFDAFEKANECARQSNDVRGIVYRRDQGEAGVRAAAENFPKGILTAPHASPGRGRDLIFIVGMPRSGSTLVDQILSSHSKVTSVGESMSLARVVAAISARQKRTGEPLGALVERNADEWEALYRNGLKSDAAAGDFIVDKSLQNFWHAGLIARLFPAAKIIEMQRDPMDVGLSIYKLLFFGAHPYANSLEDIAHYEKCFEAVCEYWARALPRPQYRLVYEDLVADFDAQLSALFDYCGLDVEEACRQFHKSTRSVFTLSAAQVREGLDPTRKGSWRSYEKRLQPLRNALDATAIPVPASD